MSRPRFLADHDLNDHIVQGVRRREPAVEFLRVREVGLEERSDPEILEFAAREHLIVVSHDVSTMSAAAYARLAAGQQLAGLLLVNQFYPLAPSIESLVLIWSASEAQEWLGEIRFSPL